MCLNPRHIVNPSSWVDPNSTQALFIDVPCGKCSECLVSYCNEWRNRAYYEALDCLSQGGYILFDTLTYRNGNLPHVSDYVAVPESLDFPCFSKYDIDHFISFLRRMVNYRGFDAKNKLRYFVACEYGSDIRYTKRPHYHILLFVNCGIPFYELSKLVSQCWIHGITDGYPYKPMSYVQTHNVFNEVNQSQRFCINYVTKYCTKDFSYNNLVQSRLTKLLSYNFDVYNFVKGFVKCSHWQSKGFGNDAIIKFVGKQKLLEDGKFKVMVKNGLTRLVSIHKSLQRKILYDCFRDVNGSVYFVLNSYGFVYKKKFFERSVKYLADKFGSFENYDDCLKEVRDNYLIANRFKSGDVGFVIDNSYNIHSGLRNYSSVDYCFIRKRVFSKVDYGSKKNGFCPCSVKLVNRYPSDGEVVPLSFVKNNVLSSKSYLLDRYFSLVASKGDRQLGVMQLINRLQYKFKMLDYV